MNRLRKADTNPKFEWRIQCSDFLELVNKRRYCGCRFSIGIMGSLIQHEE